MSALAVDLPLNPVNPIAGGVTDLLGGVASDVGKSALDAVLSWFANALADACTKVATELFHFMDTASTVNLDQGWWSGPRAHAILATVGELALSLLLLFVLLAVIQGVIGGDPGAVMRVVAKEAPTAVFGFAATLAVTAILLKVTDAASAAVLGDTPASLGRFLSGFGQASNALSGGLLAMLLFGLFLLGALLVWIELVVRSSLLYLLLAVSSLALAARVWPPARGVWRRLCELGIALILSKFVIALALALGAAALAGGGPQAGDTGTQAGLDAAGLLTGGTLMLLAAFSPFVVLRLIPVAEAAMVAQGVSRSPMRAVGTAAMTTSSLSHVGVSRAAGPSAAGGGVGAAAGGGVGAAAVPAAAGVAAARAVPRVVASAAKSVIPQTPANGSGAGGRPLGAPRS
jgi:hypothetical protein